MESSLDRAKEVFEREGFIIVNEAITPASVEHLRDTLTSIFSSRPEAIKDDIWACRSDFHGIKGQGYMMNAWKGSPYLAGIAGSAELGRIIATLGGWPGARLVYDTAWWKLTGADPVPFHRDYWGIVPCLYPHDLMTCWIALDDCLTDNGALEYALGSHKWLDDKRDRSPSGAHLNYHGPMQAAADRSGVSNPTIAFATGVAGFCTIHHGMTWHGSSANKSQGRPRRAYALHFVRTDAIYTTEKPGPPMFAYYKEAGSPLLSSAHFPITGDTGARLPDVNIECPLSLSTTSPFSQGIMELLK
jgi:hypothetical protein